MTDPKQDWADEIARHIVCDQWMDVPKFREDAIMELFAKALRDEREACARVAERVAARFHDVRWGGEEQAVKEAAQAIRTRTDQEQGACATR